MNSRRSLIAGAIAVVMVGVLLAAENHWSTFFGSRKVVLLINFVVVASIAWVVFRRFWGSGQDVEGYLQYRNNTKKFSKLAAFFFILSIVWMIFAAKVIGIDNTWGGALIFAAPALFLVLIAAIFAGLAAYFFFRTR